MPKVVLNESMNKFCLSREALRLLEEKNKLPPYSLNVNDYHKTHMRTDLDLISVVKQLGPRASDNCNLVVREVPNMSNYKIVIFGNWDIIQIEPSNIKSAKNY